MSDRLTGSPEETAGDTTAAWIRDPDSGPGAFLRPDGSCLFRVWAPLQDAIAVHLIDPPARVQPLRRMRNGWFEGVAKAEPGSRYFYRLGDGSDRPDPASRRQPEGVHGPSAVVGRRAPEADSEWRGLGLEDYTIYELHVGTFTKEGNLDALGSHVRRLRDLGITAIELMPVAQFPGSRNWGYDGVFPFAVQESYGGPEGFHRFVDKCHTEEMAVILDVVYNHLGPEGNYLGTYGPYFTDSYKTPWGMAVNFDGPWSDEVREFFIQNALYWIRDCGVDALRLDALHAVFDHTAEPFLRDLSRTVRGVAEREGRQIHLIAESDLNDRRLLLPTEREGLGLDAQWSDDFHHALHVLLTGERNGYYGDFGSVDDLSRAWRDGFVYAGQHSTFRRRRHGSRSDDLPARQFVVCSQNHDQVGNRMLGDRLSSAVPFEGLKLAAATVLLSPFVPLLFMGEEYGETSPFPYFVSHGDPELVEAVRRGRREEFAAFREGGEPLDPQDEETFRRAQLEHGRRNEGRHRLLYELYRELLRLRRDVPALRRLDKVSQEVRAGEEPAILEVGRHDPESGDRIHLLLHFGRVPAKWTVSWSRGSWLRVLDTDEDRWAVSPHIAAESTPEEIPGGAPMTISLAPLCAVLYQRRDG